MVGAIRGDGVEVRPGEFVGAVTVLMRPGMVRVGGWDRRRDGAPRPIAGGIEALLPSETQ